jgi:RimJ/RimL family protein N-acetyltransferase
VDLTEPAAPRTNAPGQPVGAPVEGAFPLARPARAPMAGRAMRLEPADPARHAADLHAAWAEDRDGRGWTYLPYGPFAAEREVADWMARTCLGEDPLFFAVVDASGRAAGLASYLRIAPQAGTVEIGHLHFAPRLSGTAEATEALALMMAHVFALGYRRCEWKCDALNTPSRRAAARLGFTFEGTHRQATHYKGRNRDTAWYAVLDREWPALELALSEWLAPANFDAAGRQRRRLAEIRDALRR